MNENELSKIAGELPPAVCTSNKDLDVLTEIRKTLKEKRGQVEKYWSEPKKKAYDAWKSITSKESDMLKKIDEIDNKYKYAINQFLTAEKLRVEQERIAKEKAEKERLEKELSEKLQSGSLEEAIEIEESFVSIPVVEKITGQSDIEISIVDLKKFLKTFIESGYNLDILDIKVNQAKLKTFCKSMKIEKFDGLMIQKVQKQILRK